MTNTLLLGDSRLVRNCKCLALGVPIRLLLWSSLCLVSAVAQITPLQPTTSTPLSVPTPLAAEKLPPGEPTIVYENGLLTITATNSTFGDVLRGIRTETGAEIDIPPQAEERVAVHLGPGLAREVVESLLTGSQFNYVLVGSDLDPKTLTRVLLFLKPPPEHPVQGTMAALQAGQAGRLSPQNENTIAVMEQVGSPSDPALAMRSQQQMLQQHRQMVMDQFSQNAPSR